MPRVFFFCVVSFFATTAFAEAPPAGRGKVAIIDGINFTTEGLHTTVREADHFYKVLAQKLTEKGWSPITPPVSQALCAGSSGGRDCLGYIARESGAVYVLRLTGEGNLKQGYALHIEAYSPRTKHSQKTQNVCDVCLTDDIARSAADLSVGLLADAANDDDETRRENQQRAAAASAAASSNLTSAPRAAEPRRLSWIPWSMIGVGAVGVGLGIWWLYEDGRSKGFQASSRVVSNETYSSEALGIASLVGGLALLAGGTVWLLLTPSSTASVSASPNHVAFSLRY